MDWFRSNVITKVPFPNPGFMRDVYPGFLQLHGFMSMNLDRHLEAHRKLFPAPDLGRRRLRAEASRVSMTNTSPSWICAPSSICRPSTPFHPSLAAERADDPSRHPIDPFCHPPRRADDGRRRARKTFRASARPEAAMLCAPIFRQAAKVHWLQPDVGHYGVFNGSPFVPNRAAHL